jgi:hypothetical protein
MGLTRDPSYRLDDARNRLRALDISQECCSHAKQFGRWDDIRVDIVVSEPFERKQNLCEVCVVNTALLMSR